MPNIKSQIKRDQTNANANLRNNAEKSKCKTAIKKVEKLAAEGKKAEAAEALKVAVSYLDQLAQSGVVAKNNADRKKASLQKLVASL